MPGKGPGGGGDYMLRLVFLIKRTLGASWLGCPKILIGVPKVL